ncbi:hypothetical protein B9479_007333 [Cryptococcus floricola]|uniref:Uncharacterized protein n=1 Tax=Cryptococcus floricola TaxID=2591691 RepID=A0A5D3AQV1_9TREE|nr:hypothetical protein B9479_007333 [Cryptococcus floricola]
MSATSTLLQAFFDDVNHSQVETSPPISKDWRVLEAYGWNKRVSKNFTPSRYDHRIHRVEGMKDAVAINAQWSLLLEDATGDEGGMSIPNDQSIERFNRAQQDLLSNPHFASQAGDIRSVLDVLSQGDKPSRKNFFTYWDGSYRVYGVRSGFKEGQQDSNRTRWTIQADKDSDDDGSIYSSDDDSDMSSLHHTLEAIRRVGVFPKGAEEIPGVAVQDFGAEDNFWPPREKGEASRDIRSFFEKGSGKDITRSPLGSKAWDIDVKYKQNCLGVSSEYTCGMTKSHEPSVAPSGENPSSTKSSGKLPEDGYIAATAAAAQLLEAGPESAMENSLFSYYTPSGHHASIGKRKRHMRGADWLVSVGKSKVSEELP